MGQIDIMLPPDATQSSGYRFCSIPAKNADPEFNQEARADTLKQRDIPPNSCPGLFNYINAMWDPCLMKGTQEFSVHFLNLVCKVKIISRKKIKETEK